MAENHQRIARINLRYPFRPNAIPVDRMRRLPALVQGGDARLRWNRDDSGKQALRWLRVELPVEVENIGAKNWSDFPRRDQSLQRPAWNRVGHHRRGVDAAGDCSAGHEIVKYQEMLPIKRYEQQTWRRGRQYNPLSPFLHRPY